MGRFAGARKIYTTLHRESLIVISIFVVSEHNHLIVKRIQHQDDRNVDGERLSGAFDDESITSKLLLKDGRPEREKAFLERICGF